MPQLPGAFSTFSPHHTNAACESHHHPSIATWLLTCSAHVLLQHVAATFPERCPSRQPSSDQIQNKQFIGHPVAKYKQWQLRAELTHPSIVMHIQVPIHCQWTTGMNDAL
jgi:hypothetical protein